MLKINLNIKYKKSIDCFFNVHSLLKKVLLIYFIYYIFDKNYLIGIILNFNLNIIKQ
jgi:hypothetical protein